MPTIGSMQARTTHADPRKMEEREISAIVKNHIRESVGYIGGEVSESRREALERYKGELYGDEVEGRSKAISTDVNDSIEDLQPDLMEIFAGGDDVVGFEPTGEEDVEYAEQATAYISHIWNKDNDGYKITHDWIKDGTLQRNGVIKIYWEEKEIQTRHTYTGLKLPQLIELDEDPDVEIIEHEEYLPDDVDPAIQELVEGSDGVFNVDLELLKLHDLTIVRTEIRKRVKVVNVPPEEFLIARGARTLCSDDFIFASHKKEHTLSDLVEMGFDWNDLKDIPSDDEEAYNEERIERFNEDDDWPYRIGGPADPAARRIWVFECYLKIDADGDGKTEMRRIWVAGGQYKVLLNEEVDDHPFEDWTPIIMPHRWHGRSIAEQTWDIQRIKTTILRQWLDNMYRVNSARTAISNLVDLEDYLTNRPAGAVRVDTDAPNVGGHFHELTTQSLQGHAMPLLEYMSQRLEQRVGITRLGQGIDENTLNKTASGQNLLMGAAQRRKLYYARNFAEAMARAYHKILLVTIQHQDEARMVRLRGKWVSVDPRAWNADMDVTPKAGLGHGTKQDKLIALEKWLAIEDRIIQLQGGADGPLIDTGHVYNTGKSYLHSMGIKGHLDHIADPDSPEAQQKEAQKAQQPPPPDPEMIKIQTQDAREREKMRMEHEREVEEMRLEHQREMLKIRMEQGQVDADREFKLLEADATAGLKTRELDIKERDVEVKREIGQHRHEQHGAPAS